MEQEVKEAKKPGPKPKQQVPLADFESLRDQYIRLEEAFIKVCHYTGNNRILIDMGFEPYQVNKNDMKKYA